MRKFLGNFFYYIRQGYSVTRAWRKAQITL